MSCGLSDKTCKSESVSLYILDESVSDDEGKFEPGQIFLGLTILDITTCFDYPMRIR